MCVSESFKSCPTVTLLSPSTFSPTVSDRNGGEQGHLDEDKAVFCFFIFDMLRKFLSILYHPVSSGAYFLAHCMLFMWLEACGASEICSNVSLT